MQGYNVVIVYNKDFDKLLFCKRSKDPYKGLYNFVGGKIEKNKSNIEEAYRELSEETGILKQDIKLHHLMDFVYPLFDCYVEAYVGKLNRDVNLIEEKHKLYWLDTEGDFFNANLYAGEGNIGHMLEQVKLSKHLIWQD